ncbi:hypothetical protein CLOM621_06297 [Clostridium sp. M62/1]|nr:hypothetical protein CLOM621_06297 [Clostridium sp. M62/1]
MSRHNNTPLFMNSFRDNTYYFSSASAVRTGRSSTEFCSQSFLFYH